jgi:hypothetical protein
MALGDPTPLVGSYYATMKLRLRAQIGDVEYKSVVAIAVNNVAINQIPVATLTLPIGRRIDTDAIAQIHDDFDKITAQQTLKVWLTVTAGANEGVILNFPNGEEILIFLGKVVGTAWRYSENREAQLTVSAVHWLAALDESSAISASSHPGNPMAWTYPLVSRQQGASTDNSTGAAGRPHYVPGGIPVLANDLSDLWQNVFYKRLKAVAQDEPIARALRPTTIANEETLDALARISNLRDSVPLEFNRDGVDSPTIASAIESALNADVGDHWVNTTMWGKIVGEWAPSFFFSVIPRVEDALIVPFTGGLQGEPWATIGSEDYTSHDLNGAMPRSLRAVGILRPAGAMTGVNEFLGARTEELGGLGGLFQPPGVDRGVVLLKDAPSWLGSGNAARLFSGNSTGTGVNGQINTALGGLTPAQVAALNAAGAIVGLPPLVTMDRVLDRMAQQWYVIEMLRGRTGEVSGKLRFDIAPGSNIVLNIAQARNIPASRNRLTTDVHATVTSVAYLIDAENQRAWTGFSLAHLRSPAENAAPGTSITGPPLYTQAWRGASLIRTILPEN